MTAEKIHDALNLLPSDLITEADAVRTAPKTAVTPWKRLLPLAACFVLLLAGGMLWGRNRDTGKAAPAEIMLQDAAAPEAAAPTMVPAEEAAPEAPAEKGSITQTPAGEASDGNHSHRYAEETGEEASDSGYSADARVTVYLDGETYVLKDGDSAAVTDILGGLSYDPEAVCRCMAEFAVDTQTLTGIEVNLTEAFARCEKGQAALTELQAATLAQIIHALQ